MASPEEHDVGKLPSTVCLIGSSRFKDLFQEWGEKLEKQGILVLCMSFFQHADHRHVSEEERRVLRQVDRRRIDLAEDVWVIDPNILVCEGCRKPCETVFDPIALGPEDVSRCHGVRLIRVEYIGEDTREEIGYASATGKPVRCLSRGFLC